ncbi:molybdenum cofactor guanylyltransferase [Croceicoccus mobilis]|uniref:Molybdenum cofactor guanylyltransferase n=1 Tax=Croceicoccus mobilis TaxID=1703339 RepID=A0A917DQU8_9SPHN|nr:molybdenum cofactor guanylyltransferase [Croceicoccus mobilis]GGD60997.1 hypothetical protein GCM10010990_08160 [Croceicoccus mobilis]
MALRLLGAVIAGGKGRRFGADKALALHDGKPLIEHAVTALGPQVDAMVLCGRDWNAMERVDDRPEPGLGPMGGINAALHLAAERGFDAVITVPVDVLPLPADLRAMLAGAGAAAFADQHLIAFWPVESLATVEDYIAGGGRRIVGALDLIGARRVTDPPGLVNINRPQDMNRFST